MLICYVPSKIAQDLCKLKTVVYFNRKVYRYFDHNLDTLRQRIDEIRLMRRIRVMKFISHIVNILSEEYDVVLDSLETNLISTEKDVLTLQFLRENLNSRFERITSNEREKNCSEEVFQYGHKSD